jgi:hypothetical protein
MIAPDSTYFKGPLEVTPTFTTPVGGGTSIPTSLWVSTVNGLQTSPGSYDPQTLSAMLTSPTLLSNPQLKEQVYAALNAAFPGGYGYFDANGNIVVVNGLGEFARIDPFLSANLHFLLSNSMYLAPVVSRLSTPNIKQAVITKLNTIDISTQQGRDAYSAIVKAASGANGLE